MGPLLEAKEAVRAGSVLPFVAHGQSGREREKGKRKRTSRLSKIPREEDKPNSPKKVEKRKRERERSVFEGRRRGEKGNCNQFQIFVYSAAQKKWYKHRGVREEDESPSVDGARVSFSVERTAFYFRSARGCRPAIGAELSRKVEGRFGRLGVPFSRRKSRARFQILTYAMAKMMT